MAKRSKTPASETPHPQDTAKPPTTKRRRQAKRTVSARSVSQRALLVLGMHRSGTSAMAGMLSLLGASVPRNQMAPHETNPAGFFESTELMRIHDEILASAGLAWDDIGVLSPDWYHSPVAEHFQQTLLAFLQDNFADSPLFVIKDPRACRFAPLWLSTLAEFKAEPHAVIIVRNPLEVAASLKARDGFVPGKSCLLWLRHVLDAERDTRGVSRSFVTYDRLLADWRGVAEALSSELGNKWSRTSHRAAVEIDQFLSPNHRHHQLDESELKARPEVVDWVKRAFEAVAGMAEGRESRAAQRTLDDIASTLAQADLAFGPMVTAQKLALQDLGAGKERLKVELESAQESLSDRDSEVERLAGELAERNETLAALDGEIERLSGELAAAQTTVAERDAQIQAIFASTSWRVTAPMRAVKRALLAILRAPYYGRLLLGRTARATYHRLPLSNRNKQRLKSFVYRNFGFLSKNPLVEKPTRSDAAETMRRNIAAFSYRPLISILMPTYNVAPVFLAKAIESIREQAYPFWELCICDDGSTNVETVETLNRYAERDGRIKLLLSKENRGISAATNAALEIADGDFIAMLDHDDELTPDALYEVASALNEAPETDAVYSDSDKIDADGVLSEPFYKPDWSLELFRGVMYIGHLLVVRRTLAKKAGGFDTRYDKVQDFELMLRVSEATDRIRHIPKILYHWRKISGSVAYGLDEKSDIGDLQVAAVNAHLERCGVAASACAHPTIGHRVVIKPKPRKTWPLVSIIIPSKDAPCHIGRCLQSIFTRTTYQDFEVIIVDNGTTDPQALAYLRQYPLKIVSYNEKFNFSRANNLGIAEARGEYVVLLNNDTEIVIPEWIEVMLFHMELPNVGAVGPLLLYPDKTVQHAGVVLGFRGTADHVMRGFPGDADGYAGSLSCTREVTAVTAACMMMRRDEYIECGGLLEYYATHYQDLDLCLRFFSSGKRILYTPRAVLIHHESVSRGQYYDSLDRALIIDTWGDLIKRGDPYYNPNFTLTRCDYTAL